MAASCSEVQSNRQMNQMYGGPKPGFTATQVQYLAFIDAGTGVTPSGDQGSPKFVHSTICRIESVQYMRINNDCK